MFDLLRRSLNEDLSCEKQMCLSACQEHFTPVLDKSKLHWVRKSKVLLVHDMAQWSNVKNGVNNLQKQLNETFRKDICSTCTLWSLPFVELTCNL